MTDNKFIILILTALFLMLVFSGVYYFLPKSNKAEIILIKEDGLYLNKSMINPNEVNGFDIKLDFKENSPKITSAKLGGSYSNYVPVVWDLENGRFVGFVNPGKDNNATVDDFIIKLTFDNSGKNVAKTVSINQGSVISLFNKEAIYLNK